MLRGSREPCAPGAARSAPSASYDRGTRADAAADVSKGARSQALLQEHLAEWKWWEVITAALYELGVALRFRASWSTPSRPPNRKGGPRGAGAGYQMEAVGRDAGRAEIWLAPKRLLSNACVRGRLLRRRGLGVGAKPLWVIRRKENLASCAAKIVLTRSQSSSMQTIASEDAAHWTPPQKQ